MHPSETRNSVVYNGIKAALLRGEFLPGERLDGRTLETRFGASSTPVRNAINRLAGERLIDQNASDGLFHPPHLTEHWLADLYVALDDTVHACLKHARINRYRLGEVSAPSGGGSADVVEQTETVFNAVASASLNAELIAIVWNLNERLRLIRSLSAEATPNQHAEITVIQATWIKGDSVRVGSLVRDYHRVRLANIRTTLSLVKQRLHSR